MKNCDLANFFCWKSRQYVFMTTVGRGETRNNKCLLFRLSTTCTVSWPVHGLRSKPKRMATPYKKHARDDDAADDKMNHRREGNWY